MNKHETHPEILKRLRRAQGHLAKVVEMIDSGSECLDAAQQLHAVTSALQAAKTLFVQDHIGHCFDNVAGTENKQLRSALEEIKAITKYL